MALDGLCSPMMFKAARPGYRLMKIAGIMAKYLAMSLAMEKVVRLPRVISSCLPIRTISISLVGDGARAIAYNRKGKLPYNGVNELLPGFGKDVYKRQTD